MADKKGEDGNILKERQILEIKISESSIKNLIYVVRGKQIMMDRDLATLYRVETGALNRAVKRNKKRFPEDFCFQLTTQEYEDLKCQIGISSLEDSGHGGRRTMPYVFTEQGISMLAAVLHSDVAIEVSIGIMRAFVEMRKYLTENEFVFRRLNDLEIKQLEYQHSADEKFEKIFQYIFENEEPKQRIFFNGQVYDAFSLLVNLVTRADKKIILIDNYVDMGTLNILAKKKKGVEVYLYTIKKAKLSFTDVENFNKQYPNLEVRYIDSFHDRFLIIDEVYGYHIGASLKDAGKKCFAINLINDVKIIEDIIKRLETETV